jgi:molecular chaperone HscB
VSSSEDYFSALGVPKKFTQNKSELEKRFYEFSRALHPDRFTGSGIQTKAISLERMSFLNQAYSTLKNPAALRDYLLKREGILNTQSSQTQNKAQLPMELAEAWFEIQELMMENELDSHRLEEFERDLAQAKADSESKIQTLEAEYDLKPSHQTLEKLGQEIQLQNYFKSITSAVAKSKES